MSALQPPRIDTEDPGAHELSESDDHFSSADEGTPNPNRLSAGTPLSPVPVTRVERVDDRPAHGEVPGTPAYEMRTKDAVPDEVEIVPEGKRSRSGTQSRGRSMSHLSQGSRPNTPGGSPIPKTVVERVDDKPAHGEVEGTLAKEMRMADAEPDEVIRAPPEARDGKIDGSGEDDQPVDEEQRQEWFRSMWEGKPDDAHPEADEPEEPAEAEDDAFGDDFDDFNEGDGDDDFGDFDEAEEAEETAEEPTPPAQPAAPDILAGLPPLNLSTLSKDDTLPAIHPYINAIFPDAQPLTPLKDLPPIDPSKTSPFLSDRSLSLWQQLVSPPPMQPPNWTRSRIRRLFLVSLGVPVDLDEILPPSKQKRLVLPNINLPSASPRPSTAMDRLKEHGGANDSTTSLDSKTGQPKKKDSSSRRLAPRPGPPPPPDFDLNAAALLCGTTVQAMSVYADDELKEHVFTLETLNQRASGVLEYWLQRKDEGVKEKEALEGVIENLVGFVKGRRGR
ncbi:hypothetical protein LTR85_005630 [Meristemomyces frigidus]|nr:hypothetical protein LTR85_005630 [Meristemomyces frigidus]